MPRRPNNLVTSSGSSKYPSMNTVIISLLEPLADSSDLSILSHIQPFSERKEYKSSWVANRIRAADWRQIFFIIYYDWTFQIFIISFFFCSWRYKNIELLLMWTLVLTMFWWRKWSAFKISNVKCVYRQYYYCCFQNQMYSSLDLCHSSTTKPLTLKFTCLCSMLWHMKQKLLD